MTAKKKSATDNPPALVNHRWNLPSIEEMVDNRLPEWAQGEHPDFSGPDGHHRLRHGFLRFAQSIISELSWHLGKAANKGIEEALALIQDPEYYETVKRRRARSVQQGKEWRKQADKDARDRERRKRGELSEAERINELGSIAYYLHYHQAAIKKLEERKKIVENHSPVSFEPEPKAAPRVIHDDGDDWSDTISFD